jgi:hypothetical protein
MKRQSGSGTKQEIVVVCTGRDQHPQKHFNTFTVDGDTVELRNFQQKNMADLAGGRIDGVQVLTTALGPMDYDPRVGRDGWRWDCSLCQQKLGRRTSLRLSGDVLRTWLIGLVTRGDRVADVSHKPR